MRRASWRGQLAFNSSPRGKMHDPAMSRRCEAPCPRPRLWRVLRVAAKAAGDHEPAGRHPWHQLEAQPRRCRVRRLSLARKGAQRLQIGPPTSSAHGRIGSARTSSSFRAEFSSAACSHGMYRAVADARARRTSECTAARRPPSSSKVLIARPARDQPQSRRSKRSIAEVVTHGLAMLLTEWRIQRLTLAVARADLRRPSERLGAASRGKTQKCSELAEIEV